MILETERLLLRDLDLNDKEAIFGYRSDAETNQFQSWIPTTLEEVEAFIIRNSKEFNLPETWYQLLITDKLTKEVIGDVGVHFIDSDQVEFGITLSKKHHHKGYASEALKGLIHLMFKDLKKHRITTSIDPDNASSLQLIERIGFRKEGHFIKSLFINGVWVDDVIYAILAEEWVNK
ncbi:Protein N-acetyltransferase, RimJ/RimL family [Chryseobacterium oleae]|uniref:Protein N-acetyltransferase, RimJ/RimL family n=1 Tax=Chryseobacterium oleae TaxID=491207 RepID=A0A1I4Y930_CHROL|nr:GNAT family protein [Chryseobacterium oleae]SFN34040.1 Protein N-acetyltransferase, RimJ/RimL family [Chryseobacterium oleae]